MSETTTLRHSGNSNKVIAAIMTKKGKESNRRGEKKKGGSRKGQEARREKGYETCRSRYRSMRKSASNDGGSSGKARR